MCGLHGRPEVRANLTPHSHCGMLSPNQILFGLRPLNPERNTASVCEALQLFNENWGGIEELLQP